MPVLRTGSPSLRSAARGPATGPIRHSAGSRHGSRYGARSAPKEPFHVWLCDADFKAIADFSFPYAIFGRGGPKWVRLRVKPTNVPPEFIVCVGFNPSSTKGVFVSRDAEGSGNSLTGLPGTGGRAFRPGDWMIRAEVDQLKSADALTTDK